MRREGSKGAGAGLGTPQAARSAFTVRGVSTFVLVSRKGPVKTETSEQIAIRSALSMFESLNTVIFKRRIGERWGGECAKGLGGKALWLRGKCRADPKWVGRRCNTKRGRDISLTFEKGVAMVEIKRGEIPRLVRSFKQIFKG
jgi:hypothetical protein